MDNKLWIGGLKTTFHMKIAEIYRCPSPQNVMASGLDPYQLWPGHPEGPVGQRSKQLQHMRPGGHPSAQRPLWIPQLFFSKRPGTDRCWMILGLEMARSEDRSLQGCRFLETVWLEFLGKGCPTAWFFEAYAETAQPWPHATELLLHVDVFCSIFCGIHWWNKCRVRRIPCW